MGLKRNTRGTSEDVGVRPATIIAVAGAFLFAIVIGHPCPTPDKYPTFLDAHMVLSTAGTASWLDGGALPRLQQEQLDIKETIMRPKQRNETLPAARQQNYGLLASYWLLAS